MFLSSDDAQWFHARDGFLGLNFIQKSDLVAGLTLASACNHKDAKWLASFFPNGITKRPDAKAVFLAHAEMNEGDDRARALVFAGLVCGWEQELVRRAAFSGNHQAQGEWAGISSGDEMREFAEKSAAAGDPVGLYELGNCFRTGEGVALDRERALLLYEQAARLGHLSAMVRYAEMGFREDDLERYKVWTTAMTLGHPGDNIGEEATRLLRRFSETGDSGRAVFALGQGLKKHIDVEATQVCEQVVSDEQFIAIVRCVNLYDRWSDDARAAVMLWVGNAKKTLARSISNDIRRMIAEIVWNERAAWGENDMRCTSSQIIAQKLISKNETEEK